jgi:hypothetical protein
MPVASNEFLNAVQLDPNYRQQTIESEFRLLALGVLLQAKEYSIRQSSKRLSQWGDHFTPPLPLDWIQTRYCAAWCAAAGIQVDAYRKAVLEACKG